MIRITEVSPRDGLQNEKRIVPTAEKIRFIDALSAAVSRVAKRRALTFADPTTFASQG